MQKDIVLLNLLKDILKAKNKIIKKVDRFGVKENLGQDEVLKIHDKYCAQSYTDLRISETINSFSDWCSTYNGKQDKSAR